jgi:Na+/proline symporter
MAVVALYTAFNISTVISAIALAISFSFASTMAPFILCIWWKKLNRTGGYAGIGCGFAAYIAISLMYPGFPASFVGFWVSLLVAVVVSLLTQNSDPARPLTNGANEEMDLSDRLGTLPLFRRLD